MKKYLSIFVVALIVMGCATVSSLPPDVKTMIWFNEIDGWLDTVGVLVARYEDPDNPDVVFEDIVFVYSLLKPKILSTIKNIMLIQELTAAQEVQLKTIENKLKILDTFVETT